MTEIYDRGMDAVRAALGRLLTIAEQFPSQGAAGSDGWETLKNSLAENGASSRRFPADVIHDEIHAVLAAGGVAEEKKSHRDGARHSPARRVGQRHRLRFGGRD